MNIKNRTKNIKAEIVAHSKSPPPLEEYLKVNVVEKNLENIK